MVVPGCIAPKINHDASYWDFSTMIWLSTFGECCFLLSHKWTFEFGWIQCFESSMRSEITIISVTSSCTDRTQFIFHVFFVPNIFIKWLFFLGGWVTPKISPVTPKFSPVTVWSRSGHGPPCLIRVFFHPNHMISISSLKLAKRLDQVRHNLAKLWICATHGINTSCFLEV